MRGFVVRGSNVPKVTSLSYNVCVIEVAPLSLSLSLSVSGFFSAKGRHFLLQCNFIGIVKVKAPITDKIREFAFV